MLDLLNRTLVDAERDEIESLVSAFKELPSSVFDAVRFRVSQIELLGTLSISDAKKGSLVLGGVAGAAAIWLLDATLGETFKEAWKSTDLHKRLVIGLARHLRSKAERIVSKVQGSNVQLPGAQMRAATETRTSAVVIVVVVRPTDDEFTVPSTAETLRRPADSAH